MIRIPLVITIAAGIAALALAGCGAPGAPAPEASGGCPAPLDNTVQDTVRRTLPAATTITCTTYTTEAAAEGKPGETSAGAPGKKVVHVEARTALPDGRVATLDVSPDGKAVHGITYAHGHGDLVESSGRGMAVLFWAFALACVVGALFVVTRKNLIAAVMGMVGSFLGIAAIYMMLYARFLAVVQMLVYAGAIMVLFVFVIMILNRPEDEPVAPSGRAGQVLGGLAILYLVGRLIVMLAQVEPPNRELAMAAPRPVDEQCVEWKKESTGALTCTRTERPDWGSVKAVGADLFGPGLFPFEAISILLLLAVVGAIAIARPLRPGDDDGEGSGDAAAPAHPEGGAV